MQIDTTRCAPATTMALLVCTAQLSVVNLRPPCSFNLLYYKPTMTRGVLHVKAVRQQSGDTICGLFAITTAVSGRENLKRYIWTVRNVEAIGRVLSLPQALFLQRHLPKHCQCKNQQLCITIYCTCSMPECYDSMMIACDSCRAWYHYNCVNLKKRFRHDVYALHFVLRNTRCLI